MRPLEEMGKFATVVIDPPWPLKPVGWATDPANGFRNAEDCYALASLDDIQALPVESTLADDALLFVWSTNGTQRAAMDFVESWGAVFKFTMPWIKNGGIQLPEGPAFNAEYVQVGKRGKPHFRDLKAFNAANYWKREGHSAKPEGFYDLLRRVTPGPRLDIFGRRRIAGFESWGNEAPDGPALPDHYQQVLIG